MTGAVSDGAGEEWHGIKRETGQSFKGQTKKSSGGTESPGSDSHGFRRAGVVAKTLKPVFAFE
jgi:hypothetical protein